MNNILSLCDAYKLSHPPQYPEHTTLVYSNHTIRGSRDPRYKEYVVFSIQYFIKEFLIKRFNAEFFNLPKDEALKPFKRRVKNYLGDLDLSHFERLHDIGYLPIKIKALKEGSVVPLRIPCLTIVNTHPDFYWVTNYLETILSCTIWGGIMSATTIHEFAKIRDKYLNLTCTDLSLRDFLLHNFSYRGMFCNEAACVSGAAFLLSTCGTDTIPSIDFLEEYYNADSDKELIGASCSATEHSVQCAGTKDDEYGTYHRLLTKIYPKGIVSIVSDTWDYFHVLTNILPRLKDVILNRDGKTVIRPDSSPKTPLEIICGDETEPEGSNYRRGSLNILWDTFGGTINEKGYKVLDSHIGLLYGESISMDLYEKICQKMMDMGFAISNLVVGIGSYAMTYVTRDTLSQAIKATYVEIDGVGRDIFKDPVTDSGMKKSARGLLYVGKDENGEYYMEDQVSKEREAEGELQPVFVNGVLVNETSLAEIRTIINEQLLREINHGTI